VAGSFLKKGGAPHNVRCARPQHTWFLLLL
jgi:hypothetical protein